MHKRLLDDRVGSGSQLSELALLLVQASQRKSVHDGPDVGHAMSVRAATAAAPSVRKELRPM